MRNTIILSGIDHKVKLDIVFKVDKKDPKENNIIDIDGNPCEGFILDIKCSVSSAYRGEYFYGCLGRLMQCIPEFFNNLSVEDKAKVEVLRHWDYNVRRGNRKQLEVLRKANVSLDNLYEARVELSKRDLYYQDGVSYGTNCYLEIMPESVIQDILSWK